MQLLALEWVANGLIFDLDEFFVWHPENGRIVTWVSWMDEDRMVTHAEAMRLYRQDPERSARWNAAQRKKWASRPHEWHVARNERRRALYAKKKLDTAQSAE